MPAPARAVPLPVLRDGGDGVPSYPCAAAHVVLGIFFLTRHKKGISALQQQRDTGIGSYQTAWTLLHKLRSALPPQGACGSALRAEQG